MKISRIKLTLGFMAVLVTFFLVTFSNNWGNAKAKNTTEKYEPKIKSIKNNPVEARKSCPKIIDELRSSIPNLEGKNIEIRRLKIIKLISDCELASQQYKSASSSLADLSTAQPQVARWHGLRAEVLFKLGNLNEAIREARLAVQLEPSNFQWKVQEARILAQTAMRNRTKRAYEAAIKIAPYDQVSVLQEELATFLKSTEPQSPDESIE
jgi:tetratricopeptide (TPR) repeat protein